MPLKQAPELYTGTGANANDILFTTSNIEHCRDFSVMSVTGAVQVLVSVDGTNFATAPLALEDQGATAMTTYALFTAAARIYKFRGVYTRIRVTQNGATATAASLKCGPGI